MNTPNAAYFAKYDALLRRWPVEVEPLDLRGRYGTTHVNACGPAGAPAIVLMHGGRATSTVWYGVVGALAQAFRVYAIDAIGDAGRSVDDGEPLVGRAGLMRWLDETLDLLGVDSTAIVGHSLGAWTSMQYALHAPGRITRLALLDPTDCLSPTPLGYKLRAIPLFVGRAPDRWRRFFLWETQGHPVDAEFLDLWASSINSDMAPRREADPAEAAASGGDCRIPDADPGGRGRPIAAEQAETAGAARAQAARRTCRDAAARRPISRCRRSTRRTSARRSST